VQHNKTLEELYLDENELGNKGAAVIIDVVKVWVYKFGLLRSHYRNWLCWAFLKTSLMKKLFRNLENLPEEIRTFMVYSWEETR
jgi:hypothetical protein